MTSSDSKVEKIQAQFLALSSVASSLNAASDELTTFVSILDEALKKLNIGLTVWVPYLYRAVEAWQYDQDEIGYAKLNGKWGLALRRIWGDEQRDDHGMEGPWPFSEAPREMRLRGVDKIPEVISALGKEAFDTTKKISEKTQQVREFASAVAKVADALGSGKGRT
jgi:hypothetical protein